MAGEWLLFGFLAEPLAEGYIASVGTPVAVTLVGLPPCVVPVGIDTPILAQVELYADVRDKGEVVQGVVGDRHIDLFWGAWTLNFNLKTDRYRDRFFDCYGRDAVDNELIKLICTAEAFG